MNFQTISVVSCFSHFQTICTEQSKHHVVYKYANQNEWFGDTVILNTVVTRGGGGTVFPEFIGGGWIRSQNSADVLDAGSLVKSSIPFEISLQVKLLCYLTT